MAERPLDIRVASPCSEPWAGMTGDERLRFCRACGLHVYNLTTMTQAEASAFVNEAEGRRCVRYYRRSDGTVLTRDCQNGSPEEVAELVRLGVRFGGLAGLMAGAALLPLAFPAPPAASADKPVETSQGTRRTPLHQSNNNCLRSASRCDASIFVNVIVLVCGRIIYNTFGRKIMGNSGGTLVSCIIQPKRLHVDSSDLAVLDLYVIEAFSVRNNCRARGKWNKSWFRQTRGSKDRCRNGRLQISGEIVAGDCSVDH